MKVDRDSAIAHFVEVYRDGTRLDNCVEVDLEAQAARVVVTDWQGRLILDGDGNIQHQVLKGRIGLRPKTGHEEAYRWYCFGWAERGWYDQAKKAAAERQQGEQSSQP